MSVWDDKMKSAAMADVETVNRQHEALRKIRAMIESVDPHDSEENKKLSSRVYKLVCETLSHTENVTRKKV